MSVLRVKFPGGAVMVRPLVAPPGLVPPPPRSPVGVSGEVLAAVAKGLPLGQVVSASGVPEERVVSVVSAVGAVLGRSARRRGAVLGEVVSARPGSCGSAVWSESGWMVQVAPGWSTSRRDMRRSVAHVMVASGEELSAAAAVLGRACPRERVGRSWAHELWCADRFGWWRMDELSSDPLVLAAWWDAWLRVRAALLRGRALVLAAAQAPVGQVGQVAAALSAPEVAWAAPAAEARRRLVCEPSPAAAAWWQRRVRLALLREPTVWVPWRLGQIGQERWLDLLNGVWGPVRERGEEGEPVAGLL